MKLLAGEGASLCGDMLGNWDEIAFMLTKKWQKTVLVTQNNSEGKTDKRSERSRYANDVYLVTNRGNNDT
jgi:hypothetical protein